VLTPNTFMGVARIRPGFGQIIDVFRSGRGCGEPHISGLVFEFLKMPDGRRVDDDGLISTGDLHLPNAVPESLEPTPGFGCFQVDEQFFAGRVGHGASQPTFVHPYQFSEYQKAAPQVPVVETCLKSRLGTTRIAGRSALNPCAFPFECFAIWNLSSDGRGLPGSSPKYR
jgi:hypothetical protein